MTQMQPWHPCIISFPPLCLELNDNRTGGISALIFLSCLNNDRERKMECLSGHLDAFLSWCPPNTISKGAEQRRCHVRPPRVGWNLHEDNVDQSKHPLLFLNASITQQLERLARISAAGGIFVKCYRREWDGGWQGL